MFSVWARSSNKIFELAQFHLIVVKYFLIFCFDGEVRCLSRASRGRVPKRSASDQQQFSGSRKAPSWECHTGRLAPMSGPLRGCNVLIKIVIIRCVFRVIKMKLNTWFACLCLWWWFLPRTWTWFAFFWRGRQNMCNCFLSGLELPPFAQTSGSRLMCWFWWISPKLFGDSRAVFIAHFQVRKQFRVWRAFFPVPYKLWAQLLFFDSKSGRKWGRG